MITDKKVKPLSNLRLSDSRIRLETRVESPEFISIERGSVGDVVEVRNNEAKISYFLKQPGRNQFGLLQLNSVFFWVKNEDFRSMFEYAS